MNHRINTIPEPYVWDESFKVFYESLDEQHQGLFQAIFSLSRYPADSDVLKRLVEIMDEHFKHEEHLLEMANYADFDVHKEAHNEFQREIKKITSPVSPDSVRWIKEWLVNHIKGTDFKYKGKLLA